jgi:hypothetical protein
MGRYVRARTNRSMQVQGSSAGPSHGGVIMQFLRVVLALSAFSPSYIFAAGIAQNENFIVLAPSEPTREEGRQFARLVLQRAETYRSQISKEWLGEELPVGAGRTAIYVHFSEQENYGRTWAKDDPKITLHSIYLTTSRDKVVGSALNHEIVHAVLATRFPHPNRLPPWLEEGIASRYDDKAIVEARQSIIRGWAQSNHAPRLTLLLTRPRLDMYDDSGYAAATSLVAFLLSRGDRQTLLRFGDSGQTIGWDASLREHYAIDGVSDLQSKWEAWLRDAATAALRDPNRSRSGA